MCMRFTVLKDTQVALAISGCVIPLSRSNTIWIRCRIFGFFSRLSARCNRLTWSTLHLTICAPAPNQMVSSESYFERSVDYHFASETNSQLSIQVALELVSVGQVSLIRSGPLLTAVRSSSSAAFCASVG